MSHFVDKDNLNAILADIWQRLVRGKADRRSPFHTPIVASVDGDGRPQQRVMVMRKVDMKAATLRFHTDIRSGKAEQLARNAAISVIGYDPAAKIQIRISGVGLVESSGSDADDAWSSSVASSRRCYLAEAAPGSVSDVPTSGLAASMEGRVPTLPETEAGRAQFAILKVEATALEWLYLAHDGHRRAAFTRQSGQWLGQWLVP